MGTIFELQFHNYQRKREETLTWESLEGRLLACRWTAENSRGPSNSKVISSGSPPKELLSQPTHLLPVRTTEAQTLAAVQCHSNRGYYTNIMLQYCHSLKHMVYTTFRELAALQSLCEWFLSYSHAYHHFILKSEVNISI
jgi:hypothetical protein